MTNPTTISSAHACAGVNAATPASTVSTGVGGGNFQLSPNSVRHRLLIASVKLQTACPFGV